MTRTLRKTTFDLMEGRWKLVIIPKLFGREGAASPIMRFSGTGGRAIPNLSQQRLIHQLRCLERDSIVQRTIN
jgi:DNA-binding HxlR family transcriptional regulator